MKKILITGGTTFVSKYAATFFARREYEVYVLNRGSKKQVDGVNLIKADRHHLGEALKNYHFDAVLDITAYDALDINDLLDGLDSFDKYIFISSSAVYPETGTQPFTENHKLDVNKYWGKYGTDKIESERVLLERVLDAYIIRPPYLYGPMNNVYREAFVLDCARNGRKFYLPQEGEMKLQFLHVEDLCRLMEIIIKDSPKEHILNVGNAERITIKEWVDMCYRTVGATLEYVSVPKDIEQRLYFCFYNYEYYLDVSKMREILPETKDMREGLMECALWYKEHPSEVNKKNYFEFIDRI